MNTLIAIDPGAVGGIAIRHGDKIECHKMPETPKDIFDILSRAYTEAMSGAFSLHPWVAGTPRTGLVKCYMELVGGYAGGSGQPGSAMFNFGRNYGQIEGMLYGLHIPFELIRPQAWQKTFSVPPKGVEKVANMPGWTAAQIKNEKKRVSQANAKRKTAHKNYLKELAQRLYPEQKVTLAVADALLILEFARKAESLNSINPQQKALL